MSLIGFLQIEKKTRFLGSAFIGRNVHQIVTFDFTCRKFFELLEFESEKLNLFKQISRRIKIYWMNLSERK